MSSNSRVLELSSLMQGNLKKESKKAEGERKKRQRSEKTLRLAIRNNQQTFKF